MRMDDGELRWISVNARALREGGGDQRRGVDVRRRDRAAHVAADAARERGGRGGGARRARDGARRNHAVRDHRHRRRRADHRLQRRRRAHARLPRRGSSSAATTRSSSTTGRSSSVCSASSASRSDPCSDTVRATTTPTRATGRSCAPTASSCPCRSPSRRSARRDGALTGYLGIGRDITAERQAARELRDAEERFRNAFDQAPIGKALVSPDGRFTRVNGALCGILGYTEQELLGTSFQSLTHADDLEADLEQHAPRARGPERGVLDGEALPACERRTTSGRSSASRSCATRPASRSISCRRSRTSASRS